MKQHMNTLFVTTPGAYLAKEGKAIVVRVKRETKLRVPILNLGGVVCLGPVGCSPKLLELCTRSNVPISFLTTGGRLMARVVGFTPGNVLLRREQYRRADDSDESLAIAVNVVTAKIANTRTVLLRAAREEPAEDKAHTLRSAANRLAQAGDDALRAATLDGLRGIEGDAARSYFSVFKHLIRNENEAFHMVGRSRRPPRDPVNALLSFLYALLMHDARAACEVVGLDPAVGFLHRDRPGRPSLALDLMEEFRAYMADRLALSLINRKQVKASGFEPCESGAVMMNDATRKTVIVEYQKRKQETVMHPFLNETVSIGLLVHLQARLLARCMRGELDGYPAFISR